MLLQKALFGNTAATLSQHKDGRTLLEGEHVNVTFGRFFAEALSQITPALDPDWGIQHLAHISPLLVEPKGHPIVTVLHHWFEGG